MKLDFVYKNNIRISLLTEGLVFFFILLISKWIGKELFNFYIFSAVVCKVVGYALIVIYPILKFKSQIYEIEIDGKGYEIFYSILILLFFIIQICLILFKIKFPVMFISLTSIYEIYYIFLRKLEF